MTSDPTLHALALVELVARLGSAEPLGEYCAISGGPECEHQLVSLVLADGIVKIAERTAFDLQSFVDEQRAVALEPDEP